MKKEMLVVLLAVGFVFAGVVSASADTVTWTLVRTASMASHTPGADNKIGTGDDGNTRCNLSNVVDCATVGAPTQGAYSYAKLTFQMASSCAAGNTGQSCTTNTDCGATITPCVACSPNPGYTYFGNNPGGFNKGLGTFTVRACENAAPVTAVSIGTSEVVTNVGGSCMTMASFNSSSGCAAGPYSTNYDLRLWTNTIPGCNFNAGLMPGLTLAGRTYDAGDPVTTGACTYTTAQISSIISDAGLGANDYLTILCGSGTLPTDLATVCIAGAPWASTVVAKTSANLASACPVTPCPTPTTCMGGTAEDVE